MWDLPRGTVWWAVCHTAQAFRALNLSQRSYFFMHRMYHLREMDYKHILLLYRRKYINRKRFLLLLQLVHRQRWSKTLSVKNWQHVVFSLDHSTDKESLILDYVEPICIDYRKPCVFLTSSKPNFLMQ